MYFITGGVGFLACIIFMVLIILFANKGKSCTVPLIAYFLSILLFLGSGYLFSRTDPSVGGVGLVDFLLRNNTVPPDLYGEWKETGDKSSYHGIYINGDSIEIYWVSDGGRTLYWAGSFDAPPDGSEPYSWQSQNDITQTSAAMVTSGESVKTFTYENGKLSYSASVLGVTTTVVAEKQQWGYFTPADGE